MKATRIRPSRNGHGTARGDFIDGTPPHDPEAEQAVLGSILHDPSRLEDVSGVLRPDHFHDEGLGRLYEHVCSMEPAVLGDPALLSRFLLDRGDLEFCGGPGRIAECLGAVGAPSNIRYYADIVCRLAARRRLINLAAEVGQQAYLDTADLADLLGELREAAENAAGITQRYTMQSAGEIADAEHSIEFFVEPILVRGMPAVLAGPSKTLKSTVAIDLGISLATQTRFLGHFWTAERARVAIFSAESGMAAIGSIVRRICAARDLDPAEVEGLLISADLPRLDKPEHLQSLRQTIKREHIDLCILDPLYLLAPTANASRLHEMGALFRAANEVCADTGATMMLVHHSVKRPGNGTREQFSPPEREDMHGAGVVEWARQWMQLARREPYEPGSGHHALWLSVGGSAGHGGLWAVDADEGRFDPQTRSLEHWAVEVRTAGDERRERARRREAEQTAAAREKLTDDCRAILDAMKRLVDPQPKTAIKDATFGGSRFNTAWNELLDTGSVEPLPGGIKRANGQSYPAFRITER